jgi:hypothetical protein
MCVNRVLKTPLYGTGRRSAKQQTAKLEDNQINTLRAMPLDRRVRKVLSMLAKLGSCSYVYPQLLRHAGYSPSRHRRCHHQLMHFSLYRSTAEKRRPRAIG